MGDIGASVGQRPNPAILSAEAGSASGRTSPSDGEAPATLAAMIAFAGRLAATAMDLDPAAGRTAIETECHASIFGRGRARNLGGKALALNRSETSATWLVTIRDQDGTSLAAITLTYALADNADRAEASERPLSADIAAPPAPVAEQPATLLEKRRQQIAAVASDVIARKGFANATMREIADAAGLHVPTMYQYVASKDEMLELVYNWTMASVRTDVAAATADCSSATQKLEATIASLIEKGDRFRHRIGVLNRELKSLSPPARARVLGDYRVLLRQIADLVSEGVASGEFRAVEPEIAANVVEAVCDIWPLRQFAVGPFGRDAFHREIAGLLLASLKAR